MKVARLAAIAPVAFLLLAVLPGAVATVPAPLHGTVTTCGSSYATCSFAFNTSAGTGWAKATSSATIGERISMQLPGEAAPSNNLSYSMYIAKLTGTYTYWTVGTFLGTDVNTGKVIYGTTNTNFTITAHCIRGCSYTYTTDNGTIVVHFTTAEMTATAIACSPTTIQAGAKTTCTTSVTDLWNASNIPTGKVKFTVGGLGSLSNKGSCSLTSGNCTFTLTAHDDACSFVSLTATYLGTSSFYKSAGSVTIYISTAC